MIATVLLGVILNVHLTLQNILITVDVKEQLSHPYHVIYFMFPNHFACVIYKSKYSSLYNLCVIVDEILSLNVYEYLPSLRQ